jgi:hypothetical protein
MYWRETNQLIITHEIRTRGVLCMRQSIREGTIAIAGVPFVADMVNFVEMLERAVLYPLGGPNKTGDQPCFRLLGTNRSRS